MTAPPEHPDQASGPSADSRAPNAPDQPPMTCQPFDPNVFDRQLSMDSVVTWGIFIVVLVTITVSNVLPEGVALVGNFVVMGVIVAWMLISFGSARVTQQLPVIGQMTESDPAGAEARIALAMKRIPLPRSVRLMLYAHLAGVRHRQDRFAESAAICLAVLSRTGSSMWAGRIGRRIVNTHVRAQLLLLLTEAQLNLRDLGGAYASILQLHQSKRTLVQTLQMTALQTQYEIAAGYYQRALDGINDKIAMAEIMPAPQCGAMHAMLALAAQQTRQTDLADWLDRRAKLVCTAQQLEHFAARLAGIANPDPNAANLS